MRCSLKFFPTQKPFWDSMKPPLPHSNPDAENLPQSLHPTLGATKAPGSGLKQGWIPGRIPCTGQVLSRLFPRPTLTDPVGAGGLWWLLRCFCSVPPALSALHDQPDVLGHLCVVSIGLLLLCWDQTHMQK